MNDDPENLDELLDALPGRLRRKVAEHLNQNDAGEAEDGPEDDEQLPLIPAPPRPPPPLPDKRYDYSHLIVYPEKRAWWRRQF